MKKTILIADDDAAIRTVLSEALFRAGYEVRASSNAAQLWKWVASGEGELIITDVVMPDENAFDLLPRIKKLRPELPIIVMSAQNTFMTAVRASERGAYEYLPKPFDLKELVGIVQRALAETGKVASKREETGENIPLIGRSLAMQEIFRAIARLMQTDLSVMINGESGTGKELVAKALHDFGKRRNKPFVAINMAAIPKDLIESELFGHEKGSFTGANARSQGRFEQAEGGTLFLDEIGDMPIEAQTRLLRVLQQGEFTTVGGRTPIKSDVRIVSATHKDLRQLISLGLFREDLYYRLNVVPMRLPPLRDRTEDIPDLVHHFSNQLAKQGLTSKAFDAGAMEALKLWKWYGNVRELENFIKRLTALYPQDVINSAIVLNELKENAVRVEEVSTPSETPQNFHEQVKMQIEKHFQNHGDNPPFGLYHRILREFEAPFLEVVLAKTKGNQIKAAEILGLNRNTLRKKIQELELK